MFEVGAHYTITMTDPTAGPDGVIYLRGTVMEFQFPVLKLNRDNGGEKIINTSAPVFVSAEPTA